MPIDPDTSERESTSSQGDELGANLPSTQGSAGENDESHGYGTGHFDDEEDKELIKEHEKATEELIQYQAKLSPKAQRILQILGGWVFGFLIWFFLALGVMYPTNELLNWVFLVVFLIAMLLRNQIEQRTGVSMRTFMIWFLVSMIVFLIVFIILGPLTGVLM